MLRMSLEQIGSKSASSAPAIQAPLAGMTLIGALGILVLVLLIAALIKYVFFSRSRG